MSTPETPASPPSAGAPPTASDQPNWGAYTRVAIIAAIAGWALFAIAGFSNLGAASEEHKHDAKSRFMVGYLSGYIFWFSLPLGGMALLMIRYLAKSSWGLLLTRPFEAATRTLPLMLILWVPLAVAVVTHDASPYWWSHDHHEKPEKPEPSMTSPGDKRDQATAAGKGQIARAHDRQEDYQKAIKEAHHAEANDIDKARYGFTSKDGTGFVVVGLVLFAIWGGMIFLLNKWGRETSAATDPAVVDRGLEKLQNLSGPGLIVFAITITAAASQWVMSLEPGWSSTMFPVIFAVNQFLTCFAFCLSLFLLWASRPPFKGYMRSKFQLDMGTLLLAFTLFWSYTSFSQFMLVWIGNLPEEIPFYLKRSNYHGARSGWWYVSAALIALHFALPFLLLLFRNIKLHPVKLRIVATYLVCLCVVDVIWWIAPSAPAHGSFPTWLIDVGAVFGVGGVWGVYFIHQLKKRPLFADNQAFLLPEGHDHGSH